jgi:nitrite reductase/ring-hydroxylating ferredoxin subunit
MVHSMIDKNKDILITNIGGNCYGASNICSHEGSNLYEGKLGGKKLTCPWHGAKWDVKTGG